MEELEVHLLSLLKGEHSSLAISFNDHASNYVSVKEAAEEGSMLDFGDWVSEAEKQKAIDTNRVWAVQWYPQTPVGFHAVLASSLAVAVEAALAHDSV